MIGGGAPAAARAGGTVRGRAGLLTGLVTDLGMGQGRARGLAPGLGMDMEAVGLVAVDTVAVLVAVATAVRAVILAALLRRKRNTLYMILTLSMKNENYVVCELYM